jgi:hypothetical protein
MRSGHSATRRGGLTTLAALLLLFASACGDDSSTGPEGVVSISDLAGTWTILVWEYTLDGDSTYRVNWCDSEDLIGGLTLSSDGDFLMLTQMPWGWGRDEGLLSVQDSAIYWDGQGDEELVPFGLAVDMTPAGELETTLWLWWPEVETVDMDRDGQPENAWLMIVLRKIPAGPGGVQVTGNYAVMYDFGAVSQTDSTSFSCSGAIDLINLSGGDLIGRFEASTGPDAACMSASGYFTGTVDADGDMSVSSDLFEEYLLGAVPDWTLVDGSTAITGTLIGDQLSLAANATLLIVTIQWEVYLQVTGTRT